MSSGPSGCPSFYLQKIFTPLPPSSSPPPVSVRVLVPGLGFLDRRSPYGQFRVSWRGGGRGHRGLGFILISHTLSWTARRSRQLRPGGSWGVGEIPRGDSINPWHGQPDGPDSPDKPDQGGPGGLEKFQRGIAWTARRSRQPRQLRLGGSGGLEKFQREIAWTARRSRQPRQARPGGVLGGERNSKGRLHGQPDGPDSPDSSDQGGPGGLKEIPRGDYTDSQTVQTAQTAQTAQTRGVLGVLGGQSRQLRVICHPLPAPAGCSCCPHLLEQHGCKHGS